MVLDVSRSSTTLVKTEVSSPVEGRCDLRHKTDIEVNMQATNHKVIEPAYASDNDVKISDQVSDETPTANGEYERHDSDRRMTKSNADYVNLRNDQSDFDTDYHSIEQFKPGNEKQENKDPVFELSIPDIRSFIWNLYNQTQFPGRAQSDESDAIDSDDGENKSEE